MKNSISFILLLFISFQGHSQETIRATGKVIDAETKEPLVYASIGIQGKPIGTITNEDGNFELSLSDNLSKDSLVISMLGYSKLKILVDEIIANHLLELEPVAITLDEVVFAIDQPTAKEIILLALSKVEENYPTKPYSYEGFIREVHSEDGKVSALTEGVFEVFDKGYKVKKKFPSFVRIDEKIDLKGVRSSKNYLDESSKSMTNRFNTIVEALRYNPVRYPQKSFVDNLHGGNKCTIEEIINMDEHTVYGISLLTHFSHIPTFERVDYLYIDTETYAVYKYHSYQHPRINGDLYADEFAIGDGKLIFKKKKVEVKYEFESYQDKLYLKFYDEKIYWDGAKPESSTHDHEIENHTTLVVTKVNVSKKGRSQNPMTPSWSLAIQAPPYNADFWNQLENVSLVPLTQKQLKDLQREMPLEEQFRLSE